MQCNLERSEDQARWHVSLGWGWGGCRRQRHRVWEKRDGADPEPTTPSCLRLLSSLCSWCWRTGCIGSSPTTCSQVGQGAEVDPGWGWERVGSTAGLTPPPPLPQPTVPKTWPLSWCTMASSTR